MNKIHCSNILGKRSFSQSNKWFWFLYSLAVMVGIFWRVHLIADQIILDDEWHALNFSINHSLWYMLTHFSRAGANIIPINAYARILLVSSGWSEILLILPSLIAGISGLIIFPLVLKRIFNTRVTLFFAFLFALSPFIIFYSRVCRPYSIYTFLGFLGIWILYEWSLTGKKRFSLLFLAIGTLCIYFHFVGVIFVFVPLCCAIIVKLMPKFPRLPAIRERVLPSFTEFTQLGCGILICLAILLTLAIIQQLPNMNKNVIPTEMSIQSVIGFCQILSGTANHFLNILFYVLLSIGLIQLFRKSFLLGFTFVNVFLAYMFVFFVTRFDYAHVPLVLSRYIMPAFPMGSLLVALGMDNIWRTMSNLPKNKKITNAMCYGAAFCFLSGLSLTGPLRQTYLAPNNFTNHSSFQESYVPLNWTYPRMSNMLQRPYTVNHKNMSTFYRTIADQAAVKKIIEYPMPLGNHFNLYYYYQRFHKKNVVVGYTRSIKALSDLPSGSVLGDMIVDQVLSKVKDPGQLKFQNMVDILDMAAVKNSRADLVIFHKNTEMEILEPRTGNHGTEIPPLISAISQTYFKIFGKPVYEDSDLIVFKTR